MEKNHINKKKPKFASALEKIDIEPPEVWDFSTMFLFPLKAFFFFLVSYS